MPENSVHPLTRTAWRKWLERNHAASSGIWLVFYKRETGKPRVEYAAAVEEALCFGWIDSKPNKFDEERSLLWFALRKPRSGWSKPNKERIGRLIKDGRMADAGLRIVQAAKKDGSWLALDAVEALEIPPDLKRALAALPRAAAFYDAFPRSVKRGILEWIHSAKKPETRAARIAQTAAMANRNERANQWRAKPA